MAEKHLIHVTFGDRAQDPIRFQVGAVTYREAQEALTAYQLPLGTFYRQSTPGWWTIVENLDEALGPNTYYGLREHQLLPFITRLKRRLERETPEQPPATGTLFEAVDRYDHSALLTLLHQGIDVNDKNEYDQTPLDEAIEIGNMVAAELLILSGADINTGRGTGKPTPLHLAVDADDYLMTKILLDAGANPNVQDAAGNTPLHIAAREANADITQLLLEHGADPTISDLRRRTAEDVAITNGNNGIANLIRYYQRPTLVDARSLILDPSVPLVIQQRLTAAPDVLVPDNTLPIDAALLLAAGLGDIESVSRLIAAGADINAKGDLKYTPLILAIQSRNLPTVQLLIDEGASIFAEEFHEAIRSHDLPIIEALLKGGAKVSQPRVAGNTPLHFAVLYNDEDTTGLLLDYGADPNIENDAGLTPIAEAERKGNHDLANFIRYY